MKQTRKQNWNKANHETDHEDETEHETDHEAQDGDETDHEDKTEISQITLSLKI